MAKLRISVVQYLNTAPLVWGFTHGPLVGRYDLSFTVPAQCAESLRRGEADVAIIPAIEYQRMGNVVALPRMAVAAKREVRSILVLAKKPLEQVRRFALDRSSRSSAALVRLLCAGRWKIAPEFIEMPPDPAAMLAEADAALVIGDPALRVSLDTESGRDPVPGFVVIHDVAEEWRKMTGTPCVLALWAALRDSVTPQVIADFLASREFGMARLGDIAEEASRELKLPAPALERYLRENIDFTLDAENLAGLELYYSKAAAAGLVPRAKPLEFAAAPEWVARQGA